MFELKGKYLTSRHYARRIPFLSLCTYDMSYVEKSSFYYKTIPFPTRLIDLQSDFQEKYSKGLQYYFRKAEQIGFQIKRPDLMPDLVDMYQPIIESKNLNPVLTGNLKKKSNYYYSAIYHPQMGRLAAHLNIGDWEERKAYAYLNASNFRSFSKNEDQQLCSTANKFLYHQDMVFLKSKGYRYFDFVGTKEPINQMKKQFGGEIVMTYTHVPYPVYLLKKWRKVFSRS